MGLLLDYLNNVFREVKVFNDWYIEHLTPDRIAREVVQRN